MNLRVLQASWGVADELGGAVSQAIARANAAGVLFVAAAGNGELVTGTDTLVPVDLDAPGKDEFPCEDASPNVICVAATNQLDALGRVLELRRHRGRHRGAGLPHPLDGSHRADLRVRRPVVLRVRRHVDGGADGVGRRRRHPGGGAATRRRRLRARILTSVDTPSDLSGKVASNGRLDVCKAIPNCDGRPGDRADRAHQGPRAGG